MKNHQQHGSVSFLVVVVLVLSVAEAQSGPTPDTNPNMYARFSPSMAVIIAILVAALFFMGFFSIYIRHCYDATGGAGAGAGVGRGGLSLRGRRAAAARGLDHSVIETFPTFSYSEVKDHKIGKGALECAVCLNEFEDDETLRLLPKCDHVFHPECIDAWLGSHVTCPVCRANLDPLAVTEPESRVTEPAELGDRNRDDAVERTQSMNDEIIVQVDADQPERNLSFEQPSRPARSWSIRRPKMLGFGKFRSHSTGHSLVQPGENLERFTLRLPEEVRKEVMDRAMLNRTRSLAAGLQREGSSRKGYRTGEEGSNRAGRFYRRIELPGRGTSSDRWVFFTRGLSFRSPRVVAENGEGSTSSKRGGGGGKTPVKMPSFKCLEPKTDGEDENRPFSGQSPV